MSIECLHEEMIQEIMERAKPQIKSKIFEHYANEFDRYTSHWSKYRNKGDRDPGKSLPYDDWDSWLYVWQLGNDTYQDSSTLRSSVEKMVSYVVSDKVTYNVVTREPFEDKVSDDMINKIKQVVAVVTSQPWWHAMQEESVKRRYRDGEYFRRIFVSGKRIQVRFVEPKDVLPDHGDQNMMEVAPFGIFYFDNGDDTVDPSNPTHYHIRNGYTRGNQNRPIFEKVPDSRIQHTTFGVDANDPRGINLGWLGFCELMKAAETNEAMCELALTQASFAAIRKYESAVRASVLDSISKGEQATMDSLNGGRRIPGQVVDAKGFDLEIPGVDVDAKGFVDIIAQQFRIFGNLLDMPEFFFGDADTGNRSGLISAEGPFDRRVRREQKILGIDDVELIWKAVEVMAKLRNIKELKDMVEIKPEFQSAATRDRDKEADTEIKKVAAGIQSKRGAIANCTGDPDRVQKEIDEEREKAAADDPDLRAFLSPDQRGVISAKDGEQAPDGQQMRSDQRMVGDKPPAERDRRK